DAPESSGANFLGSVVEFGDGEIFPGGLIHLFAVVLQHGYHDAVTGADIVEQEITVGMKLLLAERGSDGETAAVDFCALGSSRKCLYVASIAANFVQSFSAQTGPRGWRGLGVASGSLGGGQ